MILLMDALRDRRQRPTPRALHAPGRRDDAHAVHPLDGADHVDAAEERPPAPAGLFHETEALEPGLLPEGRRIAAELAAVQLEAEDPQPVAQPEEPDIAGIPRRVLARSEELPQPPERDGIESGDDQLAFRHQDALGFT